jgi:hypothetical protein
MARIGRESGRLFHGAMDDFRIYDRALSLEEIAGLARGE